MLWSSGEFGFVGLPENAATGSSMMPQKLNPDVAELARGKAGTAIGRLTGLLATVKGLPLAYDRDLQEDKAPVFAARADTRLGLRALAALITGLKVDRGRMAAAASDPLVLATDAAEALVRTACRSARRTSALRRACATARSRRPVRRQKASPAAERPGRAACARHSPSRVRASCPRASEGPCDVDGPRRRRRDVTDLRRQPMKRIAIAASLLLAAAAIAGVARPEGAHAVDGTAATSPDSITVAGNGSVNGVPTSASFSFGVDVRAASAKAAIAANSREMRQVIAAVKSAGGRNVGTQSVSLSQAFTNDGEPSGFAASNVVTATIDLAKAGP